MGMRVRSAAIALAAILIVGGAGAAYSAHSPTLSSDGPTSVSGTTATAVFTIGTKTIRQVRYADREMLRYTFDIANNGLIPMTVIGLAPLAQPPTLLDYRSLTDREGLDEFTIAPRSSRVVTLSMLMTACERLSARAGSLATEVRVRTTSLGAFDGTVTIDLPEQVQVGSPREASCPRATASSRPPG